MRLAAVAFFAGVVLFPFLTMQSLTISTSDAIGSEMWWISLRPAGLIRSPRASRGLYVHKLPSAASSALIPAAHGANMNLDYVIGPSLIAATEGEIR